MKLNRSIRELEKYKDTVSKDLFELEAFLAFEPYPNPSKEDRETLLSLKEQLVNVDALIEKCFNYILVPNKVLSLSSWAEDEAKALLEGMFVKSNLKYESINETLYKTITQCLMLDYLDHAVDKEHIL